jgi:hypothetical protein
VVAAGPGRRRDAAAAIEQDPTRATSRLREAAGALRLALIEGWGERSSSMGRDWTRFERMADRRGRRDLAERLAVLADADPQTVARRADLAPAWPRERIDLAAGARRLIGEDVTSAQNARDQLLAFATHVARHRPDQAGPWMAGEPEPDLPATLAKLDQLMARVRAGGEGQGRGRPPTSRVPPISPVSASRRTRSRRTTQVR